MSRTLTVFCPQGEQERRSDGCTQAGEWLVNSHRRPYLREGCGACGLKLQGDDTQHLRKVSRHGGVEGKAWGAEVGAEEKLNCFYRVTVTLMSQ